MLLFENGAAPIPRPRAPRTFLSVSGAGDTALAVLQGRGLPPARGTAEAADLANRASGIAVGKLGTATVTMDGAGRGILIGIQDGSQVQTDSHVSGYFLGVLPGVAVAFSCLLWRQAFGKRPRSQPVFF